MLAQPVHRYGVSEPVEHADDEVPIRRVGIDHDDALRARKRDQYRPPSENRQDPEAEAPERVMGGTGKGGRVQCGVLGCGAAILLLRVLAS